MRNGKSGEENRESRLNELIHINDVPSHLPRRQGKKVHVSTIWRWIKRGVKGTKLGTVSVGGRVYVCPSELERFIACRSQAGAGTAETTMPQPPAQRRREAERAAREVEAILGSHAKPERP